MKDKSKDGLSRRSTLRLAAAAGGAAMLPAMTVNAKSPETTLGSFEDSLDGWRTNGSNELSRVSDEERPYAVKSGSYALQVMTTGDPHPMIENTTRVQAVDFVENPYLLADVTVGELASTVEPVTFVFRLHHDASSNSDNDDRNSGGGSNGGTNSKDGGSGAKSALVETASTTTSILSETKVSWDMTDVAESKRENATRLDMAWYVGEEPDHGPRGNGPGTGITGDIVLDNIVVTDDRRAGERAALQGHVESLIVERGLYDYEAIEYTADGERGEFNFDDGSVVAIEWVDVGPDAERYTIGDRTFEFGGEGA